MISILFLLTLCLWALTLLFLKGRPSHRCAKFVDFPRSVTRTTSDLDRKSPQSTAQVIILENHSLQDFITYLKRHCRFTPALNKLLNMYDVERSFPDMSDFRLGPNVFEKILLDWIIFLDPAAGSGETELIGHGVTTRIHWDQNLKDLPDGWQGAVRNAYETINTKGKERNTLVGLFILIEADFRQHEWAGNVIQQMQALGKKNGLSALIIPLRPPSRYQKEYAAMPMHEFAALTREDGLPQDHWVRLHVRLGARIVGDSSVSHQHAMSLKDFYRQISCPPITQSGYTLVQQRDGGWYNVYVDLEREFVLINQGCVWAQHPLSEVLESPV